MMFTEGFLVFLLMVSIFLIVWHTKSLETGILVASSIGVFALWMIPGRTVGIYLLSFPGLGLYEFELTTNHLKIIMSIGYILFIMFFKKKVEELVV